MVQISTEIRRKMKLFNYFITLFAIIWFAGTAFGNYIQPHYNKPTNTIIYIDRIYFEVDSWTGVAGYKTIDKMVYLEKSEFHDFSGNKIFMVQTLPDKEIVGYGIKVWESEFSLEDSNCDGTMDKVSIYNDPVFPPDCWYGRIPI